MDATSDLSKEMLDSNFSYWTAKYKADSSNEFVMAIPATHSFPFIKNCGKGQTKEVWKEILFECRGLHSDQKRSERGALVPGEQQRVMSRARETRLNHFVFSYLGVHDPYYTGAEGNIPFGIFLHPRIESFPFSNATRRDLSSPEAEWPPEREFLFPVDGRRLSARQVASEGRHGNDFWHYWGSQKYRGTPNYLSTHWQWKIELHYHEEVGIGGFSAVLWPFSMLHAEGDAKERVFWGDVDRFQLENPSCPVIPYEWIPGQNIGSFMRSSEAVVKFFIARGRYPVDASDAL